MALYGYLKLVGVLRSLLVIIMDSQEPLPAATTAICWLLNKANTLLPYKVHLGSPNVRCQVDALLLCS